MWQMLSKKIRGQHYSVELLASFLSHMYWEMSLHVFCLKISFLRYVSIALLFFCPLYMHLFLVETVQSTPRHRQHAPWLHEALKIVKERYNLMRHATTIVISS
ncbi:unnamed protein product [Camellia sinensis]